MSRFSEALAEKNFVITVEVDPPKGTDLKPLKELGDALKGRVDALVVSDNAGAVVRMSPLPAALELSKAGVEIVLTLTCRDRNRLALTSDMLAASAAGIENLLIVSGDFVTLGDHTDGKPVYDLDSVQALELAVGLGQGRDMTGAELAGAAPFFLGSSVAATANPLLPQLIKFRKKVQAGARFFITQPVTGTDQLRNFLHQAETDGLPILAWVESSGPDGLDAAARLAGEIRELKLVAGVHLSAADGTNALLDFLNRCGL